MFLDDISLSHLLSSVHFQFWIKTEVLVDLKLTLWNHSSDKLSRYVWEYL